MYDSKSVLLKILKMLIRREQIKREISKAEDIHIMKNELRKITGRMMSEIAGL